MLLDIALAHNDVVRDTLEEIATELGPDMGVAQKLLRLIVTYVMTAYVYQRGTAKWGGLCWGGFRPCSLCLVCPAPTSQCH